MKILCVVPARGGSKRVPRKNIADLGGKPLIVWTLEQIKKADIFDLVFVSTEDEQIGHKSNDYWDRTRNEQIWWKRDPKLALDTTPTLPVVMEVFDAYPADIVVTLQPTSPFRTAEDIENAIDMHLALNADAIISVTEAPNDLAFEVGFAQRLRQVPNIVIPNGAIFTISGEALSKGLSWFTVNTLYGYSMPKERSLDIDNGQDLEIARMLVREGKFK